MLCFLYSVLMIVFRCPFFKLNGKLNLAIQAVAIRFAFGLRCLHVGDVGNFLLKVR